VDHVLRLARGYLAEAPPEWAPIDKADNEYGCGVYGCVIPTHDRNIVLKLTTDDTEAEFASGLANKLVAPVCVKYHRVVETSITHNARQVFLLWRDVAFDVGDIDMLLPGAGNHIDHQHESGQLAYWAAYTKQPQHVLHEHVAGWVDALRRMTLSKKFPEIRRFAEGLLGIWKAQHVLFGDLHEDNLGFDNDGNIVIVDPGHIAVINAEWATS
jgi:hypothetical protein